MIIPIVDENDKLLYYKDLDERDPRREITRASCVWIVNEKNEILLAKRSKYHTNLPNLWGPSAAGSLKEGETYEDNIIKEAQEEIGVKLEKIVPGPKLRDSDTHEFFAQYFFSQIHSDTKFILQEREVDEAKWVSLSELKEWYRLHPEEFLPTFDKSLKVIEDYEAQSKKT